MNVPRRRNLVDVPTPIRCDSVELRRIALPLVEPFRTATGTVTVRDLLLVRVVADGVEGWGECAALPEPTYTAEDVAGAQRVLTDHLVPRLFAAGPVTPEGLAGALKERGVLVRWFRVLPDALRISVGTDAQVDRLLDELRSIVAR